MRDSKIKALRENTLGEIKEETLSMEVFQNKCLRPILKFNNPIILALYKLYVKQYKNVYYNLDLSKKETYIENAFLKDAKFKNKTIGAVIGLMTLDEMEFYTANKSDCNKRISSLLVERVKSQMQLFETNL